ncbi:MAG: hypothetical protein WC975_11185 [Phycisphaerae bacterium]
MIKKRCSTRKVERGIILPFVLVMMMLLGMLAIGFSFSTRAEYSAIQAQSAMDQAQECAMSGIESASLLLRTSFADYQLWYNNPQLFKDQPVEVQTDRQEQKNIWRYSLVGYNLDSQDIIRYGVTDEAGKVNINVASEEQLKHLLGITAEMAANLLVWRGDVSDSGGGATDEYYMALPQPYRCKNAPLNTIEELLLVKGFTAQIIFGEDMNRNGILDPNEDDGKKSLPIDNGDGVLDRGLYPYITIYSRDTEFTDSDPFMPRINIQETPSLELKLILDGKLRPEIIDFIIKLKSANADFGNSPASLLVMDSNGKIKNESDDNITNDNVTNDNVTNDNATNDNATQSPVIRDDMGAIMDLLTTGKHVSPDGFVYGRINVNTAPRVVLASIGRLTPSEIDAIISTRGQLDSQDKKTIAWLVKRDALSPKKFNQVAALFTARSYQFMIDSLGYCDRQALQTRIQTVLEVQLTKIQYLYWRDLTSLGKAYNIIDLGDSKIVVKQ